VNVFADLIHPLEDRVAYCNPDHHRRPPALHDRTLRFRRRRLRRKGGVPVG
jgi:hypothetical protein